MQEKETNRKILTIPNVLSFFRICLIPVLIWSYCGKKNYLQTAIVLVLSGLTDLADGFIARHFHMTSDLGKILDPVADKLTQGAMLICLVTRFPLMWVPLGILIVKETVMAITGALVIKRTGNVHGSNWHGKVTTTLLYIMMGIHILWYRIPEKISDATILLCSCMMCISFVLYVLKNCRLLKESSNAAKQESSKWKHEGKDK